MADKNESNNVTENNIIRRYELLYNEVNQRKQEFDTAKNSEDIEKVVDNLHVLLEKYFYDPLLTEIQGFPLTDLSIYIHHRELHSDIGKVLEIVMVKIKSVIAAEKKKEDARQLKKFFQKCATGKDEITKDIFQKCAEHSDEIAKIIL